MKGVVFVELLSMADHLLGEDAVDAVLDSLESTTQGSYTAVGNYPCSELMALVEAFSDYSGASQQSLQISFGRWIFERFSQTYQVFFEGKDNAFSMLESIENEVHVEVQKLYPEAELPRFATERVGKDHLRMIYSSERPLVDFCLGMIEACLAHFDQEADIKTDPIETQGGFGARFDIRLHQRAAA